MDETVLYDISYGMYVVTTKHQGKNVGCIANSFCQITANDFVVSISLNKDNFTNTAIKQTKRFCLSIISEKTNPEVIKKFGFYSSSKIDKFDEFEYENIDNLPVIKENTCGYVFCDVFDVVDCGSHDLFLAKISHSQKLESTTPMTYAYYHEVIKGKAPKNAPTYIEETAPQTDGKKHQCLLCGYIYDDATQATKFEDLPSDWQCPLCGAQKSYFKQI